MRQDGDSDSGSCGSGLFSDDGAEKGVGAAPVENFVFRADTEMVHPAPVELDESDEEAAGAASGQKRPKKKKKGKAKKGKRIPLEPNRRPRVLGGSYGGGRFLMGEVPL